MSSVSSFPDFEIPIEIWICDKPDELTRMDKLTAKIFGRNKADWIKVSSGQVPQGTLIVWKEKPL